MFQLNWLIAVCLCSYLLLKYIPDRTLSRQLLLQLLSASELLCSHDSLWVFFVHAIILPSLFSTCTWFTFDVHFALKLPNVNSINIKCFSASHPSVPLVCQGTQVITINTNMTCSYDVQQQLRSIRQWKGGAATPVLSLLEPLEAPRWCPYGWAWWPRHHLVQGGVTTRLSELISSGHAEFQPKIPSHSSLLATYSILLAMHLEGYWGPVRKISEIRAVCGENVGVFSPSLCYFPAGSVS